MSQSAAPDPRKGWTTSLGLMAGIRANDPAAWERFTALYGTLFDYWFRQGGIPEGEWADLRQTVFEAVLCGLPTYRHSPGNGSFRGWLRRIVRNKLIDRARKRVPVPNSPTLELIPAPGPDEHETPAEYRVLFRRALDLIQTDFQPTTWQAFWLVAVEDRAPADVAADLGLSLAAVHLAKSRILRRLREEFADILDDSPPP